VWWYQRLCNTILTSWWWAHVLETCRAWNKLIVKEKICASSCLITEINEMWCCRLKKICPASFRETCQWLKFPLNGLRAHNRVSPVVGLLPLASGPACLGTAFPPFLVKAVIPLWLGRHFLVCENRVYHEKVRMTVG